MLNEWGDEMMFIYLYKIGIILLIVLFVSSCTSISQMHLAGTRNIDYSATYEKVAVTQASGEVTLFFVIPLVMDDLYPMEIIDKALEKGGYDFMTDIRIKRFFVFTYILNYASFEVKGYGWRRVEPETGD
jgi:hypothetical protein